MGPDDPVCLDDEDGPVTNPPRYSRGSNSARGVGTRETPSSSPKPMCSEKLGGKEPEDERRSWSVAKSFFDARPLVADHITSYNNFVDGGVKEMFDECEPFEVVPETTYGAEGGIAKVVVRFSDPELTSKPQVDRIDRETNTDEDGKGGESIDGKSRKDGNFDKDGKVRTSWLVDTERNDGEGTGAGASTSAASGAEKGKEKASKANGKGVKLNQLGAEENKSSRGKRKASFSNSDDSPKPNDMAWADQSLPGNVHSNGSNAGRQDQEPDWSVDLDIPSEIAEKDLDGLIPRISEGLDEDWSARLFGEETANGKAPNVDEDAPDSPKIGNGRRSKRPKLVLNVDDYGEDEGEDSESKRRAEENLGSRNASEKGQQSAMETRKKNYRLLPFEARLRGMTYSTPLYVKVTLEVFHRLGTPNLDLDLLYLLYQLVLFVVVLSYLDGRCRMYDEMPVQCVLRTSLASLITSDIHRSGVGVQKKGKASTSKAASNPGHVHVIQDRVLLGKVPVMVRSSLCHLGEEPAGQHADCCLDPGGYFIIKGSEKVVVAQEERNGHKVWLANIKGTWVASFTPRRKGFSNYNYRKTLVKLTPPSKKDDGPQKGFWPLFTVVIPGVEPLALGLVLCALGVKTDREIIQMICYKDLDREKDMELHTETEESVLLDSELVQIVAPSLKDTDNQLKKAFNEWDQDSYLTSKRDVDIALYYVGSKSSSKNAPDEKQSYGQEILMSRLLPHIEDTRSKAYFLCHMVRTICLGYLGRQQPTDKDDIKNKRFEFAGEVMSHQFRKLMSHVQNTMKKRLQKHLSKNQELVSVDKYVEDKLITRGFRNAFSSGNWMGQDSVKNSGISFDLKRGNPLSTFCQLRELRQYVPPLVKVGEDARHPTFSQWGRICPIDTPDGESCGLVKNLALTGIVSCKGTETPVLECFCNHGVEPLDSLPSSRLGSVAKVLLNGRWEGVVIVDRVESLISNLKRLRRNASNPEVCEMEVIYDALKREVHVSTDRGRVLRPLLVVTENNLNLNLPEVSEYIDEEKGEPQDRFSWFLKNEVIELLGIEEEEKALIAFHAADLKRARQMQRKKRLEFSHAEIHPSLILGLSASLIPFPNRNQSSRNLFQAHKHSKQAIGLYVTNLACRSDTSGQHLFYPQVQLVKTHVVNCIQKDEVFSGQNAVVAIACYTGYNQEDSIIMDQSALDRGMFRTQHYRTFKSEERSDHEMFGKPSAVAEDGSIRALKSDTILEDDGLPFIGCDLGMSDVIIGKKIMKKSEPADDSPMIMSDTSTRLKAHEKGRVDQVILVQDEEGRKTAKVKLREMRIPQVGDKFSSMHGQKGIVGMVFTQEDLPFTHEGIVPDVIINPHAFPSRQTLGQMCESALGKATAKQGKPFLATPFMPASTVEWITDVLHESGYNGWGVETMYNGFTGKAMEAKIFVGTTFYQRLTHMVEDKIKYRSRGHVHPLTRQPVSDRKRHGGVKFGEMERDCLIAHGAAATLQERTFHLSDYHEIFVCRGCKQMAHMNADRVPRCRFCGQDKRKEIVKVEIPYACKLLIQELQSMCISVGLDTEVL
ncbi:hypothetical protein R1sor_023308 [Riccia sorocarpa]|uniref:DNA-directed RNA polymerase subunit beta n=1 Tax=Riccia sorocarpa TaxID=122646 RepID=A0ABD3GPE8_9MARC